MTPQSMGELVDELVDMGYVVRRPDPDDGRAKLIVLTQRGEDAVAAGLRAIEVQVTEGLGERGHRELRRLLSKLLDATNP